MSVTISASANIPYGVTRVCKAWSIPRSTFYDRRQRLADPDASGKRRGPAPEVSDERLAAEIRDVIGEVEELGIRGEGHRKVRARLRRRSVDSKPIKASKKRVLRVMREEGLLAPCRVGRPRGPLAHDGKVVTDAPDQMWGTDATMIMTREQGLVWVFAAVDHFTGECVGIHAAKYGTRFEALVPIDNGIREYIGPLEEGAATGLLLRHDWGPQYVANAFQDHIAFLGIESSPSFVRAPQGNGVVERFIRTLKEQLLWVETFDSEDDLLIALGRFRRTYNDEWLMERHGYRTPSESRADYVARSQRAA